MPVGAPKQLNTRIVTTGIRICGVNLQKDGGNSGSTAADNSTGRHPVQSSRGLPFTLRLSTNQGLKNFRMAEQEKHGNSIATSSILPASEIWRRARFLCSGPRLRCELPELATPCPPPRACVRSSFAPASDLRAREDRSAPASGRVCQQRVTGQYDPNRPKSYVEKPSPWPWKIARMFIGGSGYRISDRTR